MQPGRAELSLVAGLSLGAASAQPVLVPTAPRSPARKKAQASPPPRPPPTPPALSEELPWGDLTLNKCLVLASLVALLGSACQLCRGELAPQTWQLFPEERRPQSGSLCSSPPGWSTPPSSECEGVLTALCTSCSGTDLVCPMATPPFYPGPALSHSPPPRTSPGGRPMVQLPPPCK